MLVTHEHEESVSLPVERSLSDLVPLDAGRVEASLVPPGTRNDHEPLIASEPVLGSDGRVGKPEEDDDTPKSTGRTDNDELVSPGGQSTLDLTDTVADESTSCDTDTIEHVPRRDT